MSDEINNPKHYQLFPSVEAIDVIKATLTPVEFLGYLKGNALKYRLRAGDKGPAAKCIAKAHWYQNYLWNMHDRAGFEPASMVDDDSPRQQGIHQGGELGPEVYAAIDAAKGERFDDFTPQAAV
ncbi:DUF3310 domain-containing protein [Pseudomonas leptonychotis]|uniref:DUF3310 domain-containing protein n=1 Tax=Pseudomonas leptonychotis TaxID=2448482 RepID=UPI0038693E93